MLSETGLKIFYWGAYIWLFIGFLTIGIPAITELIKTFTRQGHKN